MATALCFLMCLVVLANAAPLEEKFLPKFMRADIPAVTANATVSVSASPVVVSPGSAGKKVQVKITKEIIKDTEIHGAAVHAQLPAHPAVVVAAPAQLQLDNVPFVIDNETMAGVLQKLLAGNIENVQAHGQPLVVPPGGKPVAVIYSSAMHVVDLGNLKSAVGAPVTVVHNHLHNHTGHLPINHTSLLETLISPLVSLTHQIGAHADAAAALPAAANLVQPMQMQPIVVMMPLPQAAGSLVPIDPTAQLEGVLQGILNVKQQILNNTLASHPPLVPPASVSAALDVGASASILPAAPVVAAPVVAAPVVAASAVAAPVVAAPVVAAPNIKKTVDISITKVV